MKVFVSTLISGYAEIRAAAEAAIEDLGHEAVMAEDLVPSPRSPQVACLSGVRESGAVVLLLGADYGDRQPSGFSANEEEFREARESRPVIAFVQNGVTRSLDQAAFVKEVEGWPAACFVVPSTVLTICGVTSSARSTSGRYPTRPVRSTRMRW